MTATQADSLRIEVGGVEVVSLVAAGVPPGVVILHAAGRNGPGTGRILTNADADGLQWRAPGSSTYGPEVVIAGEGNEYLLHDGEDDDCYLRIEAYASYLEADAWSEVEIRDVFENDVAQDDVTAAEALAGNVLDYTLTLRNASAGTMSDILAWIDAAVSGIEISDDDITYVAPTTRGTGLNLGSLAADATATLYVRRTITAAAASDDEVLTHLHFSFDS